MKHFLPSSKAWQRPGLCAGAELSRVSSTERGSRGSPNSPDPGPIPPTSRRDPATPPAVPDGSRAARPCSCLGRGERSGAWLGCCPTPGPTRGRGSPPAALPGFGPSRYQRGRWAPSGRDTVCLSCSSTDLMDSLGPFVSPKQTASLCSENRVLFNPGHPPRPFCSPDGRCPPRRRLKERAGEPAAGQRLYQLATKSQ